MTEDAKKPLGRILLRQRAISQPDLDKALASASIGGPPLASRLIEAGALSEVAALKALSEQSGVPGLDLNQVCIRLSDLAILPREIAVVLGLAVAATLVLGVYPRLLFELADASARTLGVAGISAAVR